MKECHEHWLAFHPLGKLGVGPGQTAFHGGDRMPGRLSHILKVHAVHATKDKYQPVVGSQFVEQAIEAA
jgi:hypothetical protein